MDDLISQLAPQLRALSELALHDGHMTQAAAALGIPQSSMSRRIHSLEATLRVPLLIRSGRKVLLTAAALSLAQQARSPLRELDIAVANVVGQGDSDHGTVSFGFPLTMGSGTVPDLLAEFHRAHPGIHLRLRQAHGSALIADLQTGRLDIAITIPSPRDLNHTVLATQQIHAVLPQHHRLAANDAVDLGDLRTETFIANPPSYNLRQLTEQWCLQAGYVPNIAVEITEFSTIHELVSRNLGVALLPQSQHRIPGTVVVPLGGGVYQREVSLAWASTTQTAVARLFASFVLSRGVTA